MIVIPQFRSSLDGQENLEWRVMGNFSKDETESRKFHLIYTHTLNGPLQEGDDMSFLVKLKIKVRKIFL